MSRFPNWTQKDIDKLIVGNKIRKNAKQIRRAERNKRSKFEMQFDTALKCHNVPFQSEYIIPTNLKRPQKRSYRYDYYFAPLNLLIELNGGLYTKSGHTSPEGITRDAEKLNYATDHGYFMKVFTTKHMQGSWAYNLAEELKNKIKDLENESK